MQESEEHLLLLLTLTLGLLLLLARLVLVLRASLVHLVEEGQAGVLEVIGLLFDLLGGGGALTGLALGDELAHLLDLLLDLLGLSLVKAVFKLLEGLLGIVHDTVGTVGSLNGRLALLVLGAVTLSIVNHGLDLRVGETRAGGNGDGLVLVGGLVLGVDVHDRIGIDVEGDLDLRNTTVGRGDTDKLEVAQKLVVADELTLTLVNLDLDGALEISSGGEDLGLLGGDSGVTVDQTREDTTEGLDTERKRGNIEQEKVSDLTSENGTLDSGTNGNSLVRVDGLGRVTTEDALHRLGDLGHASHTTDEDDLLDVLGLEGSILQGLANGVNSPGDERINQLLELSTGHLGVDVLGAGGISCDEGQVDLSLGGGGKLNLGLLSGLTDTLDSHAVVVEIDVLLLLELLDEVTDKGNVEIFTSQVSVTVGGLDLKHTVLDLKDRDIEGTTSKIVDSDDVVVGLVKTVSKSGSGRLVDDTEDVQASDLTGVLGSLTLRIVEVGGNSDDSVLDVLAHVGLGGLLHLSENEATDLRRRVLLALSLEPSITIGVLDDLVRHLLDIALNLGVGELASDETLGGEEGVFGVDDGLTLGGDTDKTLTLLGETDDGRCCAGTCDVIR